MRHSRQDALDTAERRKAQPASAWHPILAATEVAPGQWVMADAAGKRYGVIRFLTIGGQCGYRVVTWAGTTQDRQLIGYFTSLSASAVAAHGNFIRTHGKSLPRR